MVMIVKMIKKMMKKKRLKINGTVLLTFCFENTEK